MKRLLWVAVFLGSMSISAQSAVGINTTNPRSTLDINGNLSLRVEGYTGGAPGAATAIDTGIYINLTPTAGNNEFILPNATLVPGRVYIMRNITDAQDAIINSFGFVMGAGNGVEFYRGDGRTSVKTVTMTPDNAADNNDITKTLIFISDGNNWTYGRIGL